jgi:histone H3/H4
LTGKHLKFFFRSVFMAKLPLAVMGRLLNEGGAERVSQDAKEALAEVLEDYALKITRAAILLSEHAGRKTVRRDDIRLATRNL